MVHRINGLFAFRNVIYGVTEGSMQVTEIK